MRKGKKIAVAKKATAAFLTVAMVTGMLPAGQIQNVMADRRFTLCNFYRKNGVCKFFSGK
ncbi:MAG: hypothetical protein ACLUNT_05320 [Eubacterium ventriosum]